jgi:hypothetical protein
MASTLLYEGRHLSTNWKRRQGGQKVARKWRRTQSQSNPSPLLNSLLTGKLTGNSAEFGPRDYFWRPVDQQIQLLAAKFPTQKNRELFRRNREFRRRNREFCQPYPNSSSDEVFGTHRGDIRWLTADSGFDDRLRQNPKTEHGVAHHQDDDRYLAVQRRPPFAERRRFLRNVFQVCDGGFDGRTIYFDTVDWATSKPSISNSPWIRDASHSAFSLLIRRIRSRRPRSILGRPALFLDLHRQNTLKPARCQRRIVSG